MNSVLVQIQLLTTVVHITIYAGRLEVHLVGRVLEQSTEPLKTKDKSSFFKTLTKSIFSRNIQNV